MSEGNPKGSDLIKYWWYRALGYSDTQAKWQLKDKPNSKQPQRKLRHKHCENCRHLMLINETQCSRCGHKDQVPTWLRNLVSQWNVPPESLIPFLAALCLFGYLVQIKLGADFFGGIGESREVNRRILILGAALPYSFSEYLDPKNTWRGSRRRYFSVDSVEAAMGGEKCADACGKLPSVFETLADYPKQHLEQRRIRAKAAT